MITTHNRGGRKRDQAALAVPNEPGNALPSWAKRGQFARSELAALQGGLETLAMEQGMDPHDFDFLELDRLIGSSGYKALGPLVPGRTHTQIKDVVRRVWHPDNYRGKFSEEEDALLLSLQAEYGCNWKKIGELMTRMKENVRDRWREIQKNYHKGFWTLEDDEKLVEIIKRLHGGEIPKEDIAWAAVSARIKTRSRQQCRHRWYRRLAVKAGAVDDPFGTEAVLEWSKQNDVELLEQIVDQEPDNKTEIDWNVICIEKKSKRQLIDRLNLLSKYVRLGQTLQFFDMLKRLLAHLKWEAELWEESIAVLEDEVQVPRDERRHLLAIEPRATQELPNLRVSKRKGDAAHNKKDDDAAKSDDGDAPSVRPPKRAKQEIRQEQPTVVSGEGDWPGGFKLKREVKKVLKAEDLEAVSHKQVRAQIEASWNLKIVDEAKNQLKQVTTKLFERKFASYDEVMK